MQEIVNKLHENRQIEIAKNILESNGYKVEKSIEDSAIDMHRDLLQSHISDDYYGRGFTDEAAAKVIKAIENKGWNPAQYKVTKLNPKSSKDLRQRTDGLVSLSNKSLSYNDTQSRWTALYLDGEMIVGPNDIRDMPWEELSQIVGNCKIYKFM